MSKTVGLPEYTELFVENGFDSLHAMRLVTMNELNLLGISKLGHKMQILKAIVALNECAGNAGGDVLEEGAATAHL